MSKGLCVGFGGGRGGGFSACLEGGNRGILGAGAGDDAEICLATGDNVGFRMDLGSWGRFGGWGFCSGRLN